MSCGIYSLASLYLLIWNCFQRYKACWYYLIRIRRNNVSVYYITKQSSEERIVDVKKENSENEINLLSKT